MFASIDLHTLIDLSMTALLRLLDYKSLLAEKLTRTFEALVSFYPLNPVLFLIMQQICPKAKRSIWSSEMAKRSNQVSTLCKAIRKVVTVRLVYWDKS